MAATLTYAAPAKRIADRLIPEHHRHLQDATILFLFTDQTRKSKGRIVLGTAKKTSPLEQYLSASDDKHAADFILVFGQEEWFKLTEEQRVALVDHELCHCGVDYNEETDEPTWAIRGHTVEEFTEIIERHGLWEPSVRQFAAAMEQLRLPLGAEVAHGD